MTYPIVIPLSHCGGKLKDDTELRYALRSLATHFKDDFKIVIIGKHVPAWLTGAEHVYSGDGLKTALVDAARDYPDGFFWWYDDLTLLRDATGEELKITPAMKGWMAPKSGWSNSLEKIHKRLVEEGRPAFDYSRPHGPYWFDKSMVDEGFRDWPGMKSKFPWESWILSKRDWPRRYGVVKQYYGKFGSGPSPHSHLLNYNDKGNTPELRAWLAQRFPEASRFEKSPVKIQVIESRKNAISFCLYGVEAKYSVGAVENALLIPSIYPGWEMVVHVETNHYAIPQLKRLGVRVIEHSSRPDNHGHMWRFETCGESDKYERVCVRDADSRVNVREKAAVEEWLTSGKSLHVMKDHASHRNPILAGMFGVKTDAVDMKSAINSWKGNGKYGDCEKFLAQSIWPALSEDNLAHNRQFPNHAHFNGFVGEIIHPKMDAGKTRMVMLSPEKYSARRKRFMDRLDARGGILGVQCEWWKATPYENFYTPPSFRKNMNQKHWWAATCDHIRILEEFLMDESCQFLLVVEDDVVVDKDFDELYWRAWAGVPDKWKSIRFGWNVGKLAAEPVNSVIHRCPKDGAGMYFHLWNKDGANRFYDHIWHRRRLGIDGAHVDLRKMEPHDWYQTPKQIIRLESCAIQRGGDH